MSERIVIEPLGHHPEFLDTLKSWFQKEWSEYYGPSGPGDAMTDLQAYSNKRGLPVGLVAIAANRVCGIAVLKRQSVESHPHLSPWLAATLVDPDKRRQGIASQLIAGVESLARDLGFGAIYAGTETLQGALTRNGWKLLEPVKFRGEDGGIYSKVL